jgi:hypothetical protein
MKQIFPYTVLLASFALAGTAAYYSVFGLSKLFSAQAVAVIIMASILEASKLITASYLHRYWKSISGLMRVYMTSALLILMLITSIGIYGFLVSAYQETAYKLQNVEQEIAVLDLKRTRFQEQLTAVQSEQESLNKNITDLTSGLSNNIIQYRDRQGNLITTTSSATRTALELQLNRSVSRRDLLSDKEIALTDSVSLIETEILNLQTGSDVAAEIGPLKYVASITGQEVDRVVNWFILMFIFVFDPLAVILLISANKALGKGELVESKAKRVKAPTPPPAPNANLNMEMTTHNQETASDDVSDIDQQNYEDAAVAEEVIDPDDVRAVYREFMKDDSSPQQQEPLTPKQINSAETGLHTLWRTAARKK